MASLVLGAVGTAIGGAIGGSVSILGTSLTAASIGGMIGSTVGSVVDSWIVQSLQPVQKYEGQRLDSLRVTSSSEGAAIPRVYGTVRIGGNIIWATDFREERKVTTQGGKGGGGGVQTTEYAYYASFAIALCEGEIGGIGRIWADGDLLDPEDLTIRVYRGTETQSPDPFIAVKMGAEHTPAYRGTAYVVFEELPLATFGNHIPQFSFEVFRPVAEEGALESDLRSVVVIPGSGEFVYSTEVVTRQTGGGAGDLNDFGASGTGSSEPENAHTGRGRADMLESLDRLQAAAPNVEAASLVVSWFGDDLRAGECTLRPKVETALKTTSVPWVVDGVTRDQALEVSRISAPDDFSYVAQDIAAGNPSFNPTGSLFDTVPGWTRVSGSGSIEQGAGSFDPEPTIFATNPGVFEHEEAVDFAAGQPITLSFDYAAYVDDLNDVVTVDLVALSSTGTELASDSVTLGPSPDPGIRAASITVTPFSDVAKVKVRITGVENPSPNFIYVNVDMAHFSLTGYRKVFAPGSTPAFGGTPADVSVVQAIQEMKSRGLKVTFYPFILMDVPPGNTLPDPYSDNESHTGQPEFPWRGRITCSPAAGYAGTVDKTATAGAQIGAFFGAAAPGDFSVSGETVSWTGGDEWSYRRMILHYAHLCAAAGGVDTFLIGSELRGLTTIRSDASTYPAVQELAALAADVSSILGPGAKVSYAADWSEYFGHHPGDGSGDVFFHLDPFWASPDIDFVGIDNYMPLSDWRDGFDHLDAQAGAVGIQSQAYLQANIEGGEGYDWYYASDAARAAQVRTPITDGAYGKPWVFRYKDIRAWWSNQHYDRPGGVESGTPTPWVPESKPIRFTEFGCPAVDRGPNQPNVFYDPKSSESFFPYFSRGWRDDAVQRAYLEATLSYWRDDANSESGALVDAGAAAAWSWDARPFPEFPAKSDVWADAENWRLGHWLPGRLGAASLPALVRRICLDAGLTEARIDVTGLSGSVEGYPVASVESGRASLAVLAHHFGFDACESQGVIRFVSRGRPPVITVSSAGMVDSGEGEVFEITRGQESELPQALKWQVPRNDEEYDAVIVEARRTTVDSTRVSAATFPVVVPPEEADRRVRRSLAETWAGRERASFALPPSRLALDPTDVLTLAHDGRAYEFRLTQIADNEARNIEAIRQDREAYDLPPGVARTASIVTPPLPAAPAIAFLDIPVLTSDQTPRNPLLGTYANPWPGEMAVYKSEDPDEGYALVTTFTRQAAMGTLGAALPAGPVHRYDDAGEMIVNISTATLTSISETELFAGRNSFAVETAPGIWEIVQARDAELVAEGQYRLTKLLRGQRGTERAMAASVASGARVIVLDSSLVEVPVSEADIGVPYYWRIGPAARPVSDPAYTQVQFTPLARGAEPFAGVHAAQPWRRPHTPGDITIDWIWRSRDLAADLWGYGEVPTGEDAQAFEVDILDGGTVKRTLSSATASVAYTGADQTTDWGAPLAAGQTLDIAVYQVSALMGRGFLYSETLTF